MGGLRRVQMGRLVVWVGCMGGVGMGGLEEWVDGWTGGMGAEMVK